MHSEANRFLTERLAEMLADVSEQSGRESDPWYPLSVLTTSGPSCDYTLDELGFSDVLKKAARSRRVVPRRDGQLATAEDLLRIPVDAEGWLPAAQFDDLVKWTDNQQLIQVLEWLQVREFKASDFRDRVARLSQVLKSSERARLLSGILTHRNYGFIPTDPPVDLLVEQDGSLLDADTIAYFPPTDNLKFMLPHWMPLKFVAADLIENLVLQTNHSRERLGDELREVGYREVRSYEFAGIVSAVNSQVNRRCRETPERESDIRSEGLRTLKDIVLSVPDEQRPRRESSLRVRLPARDGEWRFAEELYLGQPYPQGDLMEALLGQECPESFVANLHSVVDSHTTSQVWNVLLRWLDVASEPRTERKSLSIEQNREFVQHLISRIKYPVIFEEFAAHGPDQFRLSSLEVTSVDRLELILETSDPHAILTWIVRDRRFDEWTRVGDVSNRMCATFKSHTYRFSEGHPLPSYVLWVLSESEWLPVLGGAKDAPGRCVLHGKAR